MSDGESVDKRELRVGMLTTHPIQYQVPWFRLLQAEPGLHFEVFFCMLPDERAQGEGFGVAFQWDLPLLEGYQHRVLRNRARSPSVTRFDGCDTPDIDAIVRDGAWDAFLVNGWGTRSSLQLLWACRRHGVPCIVRGEVNGLRPRARWKRALHGLLFRQYAGFLAIGTRNREYYLDAGIAPERIRMTPYGVENERFPLADRSGRDANEPFRFLFSGKLEAKKRPLDLVAACERLVERPLGRPIEFVFVGDGELRPELEAACARGLPVRLLGFVNQAEIPGVYAEADCLVLPSDSGETWGLVVNEAMATGLPAVVSDAVGCAVDLVEDGVTGSVYPLADVDALAERLRTMAMDRSEAHRQGQAAARRVRTSHSPEQVARGVVEMLTDVCGRRSRC